MRIGENSKIEKSGPAVNVVRNDPADQQPISRTDRTLNAVASSTTALQQGQALRELDTLTGSRRESASLLQMALTGLGSGRESSAKDRILDSLAIPQRNNPTTRYTVSAGETLSGIATKYEISFSDLLRSNPTVNENTQLRTGQVINVPLNNAVVTVQPGDTLSGLASRYGVTQREIMRANGITDRDSIQTGDRLKIVPNANFGLDNDTAVKSYIADTSSLLQNPIGPAGTPIPQTVDQKLTTLTTAINTQLAASGIPPITVNLVPGIAGNATYDFTTHSMNVTRATLEADLTVRGNFNSAIRTVYHEARHAEQWFNMARLMAGNPPAGTSPAETAANIATTMSIPMSIATAATASPLSPTSAQGRYVNAMYQSVYGSGAADRNTVLGNLGLPTTTQNDYNLYRALPEEADAWRVAGKITVLSGE